MLGYLGGIEYDFTYRLQELNVGSPLSIMFGD